MHRRCEWCARRLRFWQREYCRVCNTALVLDAPSGPPRKQYDAAPDRLFPWLTRGTVQGKVGA